MRFSILVKILVSVLSMWKFLKELTLNCNECFSDIFSFSVVKGYQYYSSNSPLAFACFFLR